MKHYYADISGQRVRFVPITINGDTWWSDADRTTVAPTPYELTERLIEKTTFGHRRCSAWDGLAA